MKKVSFNNDYVKENYNQNEIESQEPSYDTMVFQEEEIDGTNFRAESNFETEIDWAFRVRNISILERLFKEKQEEFEFVVDIESRTKFHLACQKGDYEIVNIILDNHHKTNIDLNDTDFHSMTGFMYACKENHCKIVELILQKQDKNTKLVNLQDVNGQNAFHMACYHGHIEVIRILLEFSHLIDFNSIDKKGNRGFHLAFDQQHYGIMEILLQTSLKATIYVNIPNDKHQTVFHQACFNGNDKTVELILKNNEFHNIDANAEDINGQSGFHLSCIHGHVSVVRILLDFPTLIDFDKKDSSQKRGFDYASKFKHKEIVKALKNFNKSSNTSTGIMSRMAAFVGIGDDSSEAQERIRLNKINENIRRGM